MKSKMTVTKSMIVDHLQSRLGIAKSITEDLVSQMFIEIVKILKSESRIQIPNFGAFEVRRKNARPGVNMRTLEKVRIVPRSVVCFVASRSLKHKVNHDE